jgi:hypothetical protein
MVVGEEDVRDALDVELGEVVEDVAAAEVDEDRLAVPAKQVDVDRVPELDDARLDLHESQV